MGCAAGGPGPHFLTTVIGRPTPKDELKIGRSHREITLMRTGKMADI